MGNTCKPQSQSGRGFIGLPAPFGGGKHADPFIVARVRPRTSKGITDLLLLFFVRLDAADPSKKMLRRTPLVGTNREDAILRLPNAAPTNRQRRWGEGEALTSGRPPLGRRFAD